MAEQQKLGVDKVVIFVDELNKYAPAGGQGGLRDTLVDIAARGRHLNVVLFGAEQFRSKVDSEILGNCGTSFYGRVGDEELTNAAYRSLSETTKHELLGLKKGTLLARHAHFRAPLFGTFPLKPTVDGMVAQRIFNSSSDGIPVGHDGDGLFKTLQDLMGDRAPRKHEVRTAFDGLGREPVTRGRGSAQSDVRDWCPRSALRSLAERAEVDRQGADWQSQGSESIRRIATLRLASIIGATRILATPPTEKPILNRGGTSARSTSKTASRPRSPTSSPETSISSCTPATSSTTRGRPGRR